MDHLATNSPVINGIRSTQNPTRMSLRGFTLIELMIAIAIVGILAAIAYPQYGSFVQQSRRSDAQVALLEAVQSLERCRSTSFSYANCTLGRTTSPEGHYDLELTNTASSYTIKATATGIQAADTDCSEMTFNHLGVRTPGADVRCWRD